MNAEERDIRWARLVELIRPIHAQALATARRLSRAREDGDDLYQDAVLRAFDKLHTLRDELRFRSWFFATLLSRHRSRSRLKFWRRFVPLEPRIEAGHEPAGDDGSSWDEDAWRAKRMALGLSGLDAVHREAIVLFEIEGFSIEEIAEMQRASIPAVKSRLVRGRERLRRTYEQNGWRDDRPGAARAERRGTREREFAPGESGPPITRRFAAMAAIGAHGKERTHE